MRIVPTFIIVGSVAAHDTAQADAQTPALVGAGAKKADIIFQRSPLRCDCSDDFVLRDDFVCERLAEIPLVAQCPTLGFKLVNRGGINVCIRERYPDEICEDYGYARVRNLCVRREVTIPQLACSEGFELELNPQLAKPKYEELVCAARVPVEPVLECPDGRPFRGVCSDAERVPAKYFCPAGFEQVTETSCRRIAQVECNTGKLKAIGGVGNAGHGKLRRLDAAAEEPKEAENAEELTGEKTEELTGAGYGGSGHGGWDRDVHLAAINGRPAEPKHGDGYAAGAYGYGGNTAGYKPWAGFKDRFTVNSNLLDIQEYCINNVTIAATAYCKKGRLQGNFCLIPSTNTGSAVSVCPAYGTPQNCFAIERSAPRSICPEHFVEECTRQGHAGKPTVDCECVKTDQHPVVVTCPPGYDLEGGLCVATATPVLACPMGSRSANGEFCIFRETAPAVCSYNIELSSFVTKKAGSGARYGAAAAAAAYDDGFGYRGGKHNNGFVSAYDKYGNVPLSSDFGFETVGVRPVHPAKTSPQIQQDHHQKH